MPARLQHRHLRLNQRRISPASSSDRNRRSCSLRCRRSRASPDAPSSAATRVVLLSCPARGADRVSPPRDAATPSSRPARCSRRPSPSMFTVGCDFQPLVSACSHGRSSIQCLHAELLLLLLASLRAFDDIRDHLLLLRAQRPRLRIIIDRDLVAIRRDERVERLHQMPRPGCPPSP